jgi:hypothetical protein
MGLFGSIDLSGFGLSGIIPIIAIILIGFIVLIVVGGITFFYYTRKSSKSSFKNLIPIFIKVNGKLIRIGQDKAKELFVPDSNISLFFLKNKKIYLARPTRAMGKDEYWEYISSNGEWVNFDISSQGELDTLAEANYDHRDTRYAFTNLRDIIKRNYKDKSVKWWKDPTIMNIISFVIMSIFFTGFILIVIWRTSALIDKVGMLIDKVAPMVQSAENQVSMAQNINSGIVPAG